MEAPSPFYETPKIKKPIVKPDNSIELNLKSDKNINYNLSIFFIEDELYFQGTSKDQFENKKYEKIYSIGEVKSNKYFYPHENVKEVYEELNLIIKNYKDLSEIKLLEKPSCLLIIFPLNTLKIKECSFELNEVILEIKDKFKEIMDKLKEINDKFFEENNLLKNQINELKNENKELKEKISKKNINIQKGEYVGKFPPGKHYMNNASGYRTWTHHITFEKKYEINPHVMVSMSSLDAGSNGTNDKNIRVRIYTKNIDTSGFDLLINTWDLSTIFEVKVSWIAFQ